MASEQRGLGEFSSAEEPREEALALGRDALAAGRLREAEAAFRRLLETRPDAEVRKQLGDVLAKQGKLEEAAERYREALADNPSFAEAHNNLGNVLKGLGDAPAAAEQYRRALALKPSLAEAHNNLGVLLAEDGKPDEAADHFRKAIAANPEHAQAERNLAKLLAGRGDFREAIAHYERALSCAPDEPDLLVDLGEALNLGGKTDEAVARYREAITLKPGLARAHLALGRVLKRQDDLESAIVHFRQAVEIAPTNPKAHNALGSALMAQGALADGLIHFRRAIELDPRYPKAHLNLGNAFERRGEFKEAAAHLRKAIELDPDYAEAHNNLGNVLLKQWKPEPAAAAFRKAIELKPSTAAAHCNLASALQDQGRYEEAVEYCKKALDLNPDLAAAHTNLGWIYQIMGRIDDAKAHFSQALSLKADLISALYAALHVEKFQRDEPMLETMRSLLDSPKITEEERSQLYFSLAKAYDDMGEADQAFAAAKEANAIERRKSGYNPTTITRLVDQAIATFGPEFFEQRPFHGSSSELPVFIVGLPRSGTTLVEQIIASHPRAFGAGELTFLQELASSLHRRARVAKPYPAGAAQLDEPAVLRLAGDYLRHLRSLGGKADRVTDKMPFNFFRLGLAALLLPRAKIIHCRRDPFDVFVSGYFMKFRQPIAYTCGQAEFAQYYRDYLRLMEHWRRVLPSAMLEVDYEELVADQEGVSRRIVSFCGLDWNDACLDFYKSERPVRTGSSVQVRRPLYADSVGRWRSYEGYLEPLKEALGDLL
jgi:tetratricopeptide (TPR) repeat protein